MTGALVDPLQGLSAGRLAQAEDVTGLGVGPRLLEVDSLVVLNGQVRLVRLEQLLGGHSDHAGVDVHELGHGASM